VKLKPTELLDLLPAVKLTEPFSSAFDATRKIGTIAVADVLLATLTAVLSLFGVTATFFHIASSPASKPVPLNVTGSPGQADSGVTFSMNGAAVLASTPPASTNKPSKLANRGARLSLRRRPRLRDGAAAGVLGTASMRLRI
jgi:hypothetical protein